VDLHKRAERSRASSISPRSTRPGCRLRAAEVSDTARPPARRGARLYAGLSGGSSGSTPGPLSRVVVARSSQITIHRVIRLPVGVWFTAYLHPGRNC
jgi:hypothetical protein